MCTLQPTDIHAAAFVRLCVETITKPNLTRGMRQPPSCGCVLKQDFTNETHPCSLQPPSCGCVLKPVGGYILNENFKAAAFVRLCVETQICDLDHSFVHAAAFVRLCVETTIYGIHGRAGTQPPSCGCVLKHGLPLRLGKYPEGSRLRAAVC